MLVKTFNLRLNMDTMQYDDSDLNTFTEKHDVLSMRTEFFFFKEEPIWSVIVTYRTPFIPSAVVQSAMEPTFNSKTKKARKGKGNRKIKLSSAQVDIYNKLAAWRTETAKSMGHPPPYLFSNRQLKEIVVLNPTSIKQLTKVYGVGNYKAATYGLELIALLKELTEHTAVQIDSVESKIISTESETVSTENPTETG